MDDVPTGQPALALAQKVIERVTAVGLPSDLIPDTITSVTVSPHVDSENALRSSVLEFMDTVRRVERAIAAGRRGEDVPEELDVATLGEISDEEWRAYWPSEDTEPAPDRIPEPTPADVPEPGPVDVPEPGPVEVPESSPEDAPESSPEDVSTEDGEPGEEADQGDARDESAAKFSA